MKNNYSIDFPVFGVGLGMEGICLVIEEKNILSKILHTNSSSNIKIINSSNNILYNIFSKEFQ